VLGVVQRRALLHQQRSLAPGCEQHVGHGAVFTATAVVGLQVIVGVPGEFTTMAGRRMRAAVAATIGDAWGAGLKVRHKATVVM
jgi:hypothetical protein